MLSLVLAVPRSAATDTWGNRVGKPPRGCWTSDPHAAVPVVSAPRGDKIRVRPVFWHLCTGDGSPERLGDFPRATARESQRQAQGRVPCSWLPLAPPLMPFLLNTPEARKGKEQG